MQGSEKQLKASKNRVNRRKITKKFKKYVNLFLYNFLWIYSNYNDKFIHKHTQNTMDEQEDWDLGEGHRGIPRKNRTKQKKRKDNKKS